jgi:MFS family permease
MVLLMAAPSGFFSSGQFALMTVYLPELFPTRLRGTAMSLVFDSSRSVSALGPLLAGRLVSFFWWHWNRCCSYIPHLYHRLDNHAVCRTRDQREIIASVI